MVLKLIALIGFALVFFLKDCWQCQKHHQLDCSMVPVWKNAFLAYEYSYRNLYLILKGDEIDVDQILSMLIFPLVEIA